MPLQILTGSAGTGKTDLLYQKIIASAAAHPDWRHIVLVPEQFTMQTQRRLVEMHPQHGIMNIDILSFDRLAYRVFDELGIGFFQLMDDVGKSMLLRKSAGQRRSELHIFWKNLGKAGFINRMKTMVSELLQYGITEDVLEQMVYKVTEHPILQEKLRDLQVFYEAFMYDKDMNTIAAEELPTRLLRVLSYSSFLKDSVLALDGFTGFTPVQYDLIGEMLRQARMVGITLTIPGEEDILAPIQDHELFAMTKETVQELMRLADTLQVPVELHQMPEGECAARAGRSPELRHLEQHFLRNKKNRCWQEPIVNLRLLQPRNPAEEAEQAVREILRLVQKEGYRYREIAVVTGDLEGSRPFLREAFERAQIPYFMDQKKGVMGNPLVVFLRSAMEAVEKGFPYEAVFRYLKTGLAGLTREEIDELENYVIATGRRGAHGWQDEWTRTYRGREHLDLDRINVLRKRAIRPLLNLRERIVIAPRAVWRATDALRELCKECGVHEKLEALRRPLEAAGDYVKAGEYERIEETIEKLLKQAEELLGEEPLSVTELGDVLDAGLSEVRLGNLPPCLDQVQIGDVRRSRLTEIRALILLNLNDGILPKSDSFGGILSDEDREILREHGLVLAPTAKVSGYQEQFYLYQLLTKPSEKLILSYSRMSGSGEAMRPSYYLDQIRRIFPGLQPEETEPGAIPVVDNWYAAREAMASTIGCLRDGEPEDWWKELYLLMRSKPEEAERLERMLDACFFRYEGGRITRSVSKMLYGEVLAGSVTRLEKYAACAYAQFLTYGLQLTERTEYEFGQLDRGNMFHKTLEYVFREMKEQKIAPEELTEEKRQELVQGGIQKAIGPNMSHVLSDSPKNMYYLGRWMRLADRTVWAICEQLKQSDFHTEAVELYFDGTRSAAMNLMLNDDDRMYLHGIVDRLDTYEEEDRVYVKIVDYKTGSNVLDLNGIYHGLQLQLIVYLDAAMEMVERKHPDKEVIPAGVFYYHIQDPLLEGNAPLPQAEMERKLVKALQMKGLTNGGNQVTEHLEENGGQKVLPDQFKDLRRHVRKKVKEFGQGIISGEIPAAPYKNKKGNACSFCAFSAVCGFDTRLPGYRFRHLADQSAEQFWSAISSEEQSASVTEGKGTVESETSSQKNRKEE